MRHTFELSDETRKIISGHAKEIADAMNVSDKYLYRILAGDETDPFAKFLATYQGTLAAGLSVTPWITKLRMIEEHYRPVSKELCVQQLTGEYTEEASDVPVARINNKPLRKQLEEVQQANAKGADLERALIFAIKEEESKNLYNGKPISFTTRNATRERMAR